MNEQDQRIAIAKACGFYVHYEGKVAYTSRDPKPNWDHRVYQSCPLPDYLNDLNAMHEAEMSLSEQQQNAYTSRLIFILIGPENQNLVVWEALTATAAQRAEAFLKTLGKWKP